MSTEIHLKDAFSLAWFRHKNKDI